MARAGSGGHGGPRQGTPGKGYANRTDLGQRYGSSQPGASAASGGMVAAAQPSPTTPRQAPPPSPEPTFMTPDQVPRLDDPTDDPSLPVTHGLDVGPGAGSEIIGIRPSSPAVAGIRGAYLANPTPELRRVLMMIDASTDIR